MAEYQNFKPNTFYADSMVSKVDDYSNIYFQFKLYFSTDSVPTGFRLVLNDAEMTQNTYERRSFFEVGFKAVVSHDFNMKFFETVKLGNCFSDENIILPS